MTPTRKHMGLAIALSLLGGVFGWLYLLGNTKRGWGTVLTGFCVVWLAVTFIPSVPGWCYIVGIVAYAAYLTNEINREGGGVPSTAESEIASRPKV